MARWGFASQRRERESEGERERERENGGGFRCCTFISWLTHTHTQTDRLSEWLCGKRSPRGSPGPSERPTHSDGNVSGIIVGQNIRTFFISKARKEREREREREGGKGSAEGKGGTPKRETGEERRGEGERGSDRGRIQSGAFSIRRTDGRTEDAEVRRERGEERRGATQLLMAKKVSVTGLRQPSE